MRDSAGLGTDTERAWADFAAYVQAGDDWVTEQLRSLVRVARTDEVLTTLYPFQSMNRLCFGHERGGPARDMPCIAVTRSGEFVVLDRTYESSEGVGPEEVAVTSSPEEALRVLERRLRR